jgi:hypothetical protein
MRGRVMSVYLIDRGLMPVGTALAGFLASLFGAPNAVLIMGIFCMALAVGIAVLVPSIAALGTPKRHSTTA